MTGQRARTTRDSVAAVDSSGSFLAISGDVDRRVALHGAVGPFLAVPLITSGAVQAFGITPEELALACSTRAGSARLRRIVEGMRQKRGVTRLEMNAGRKAPDDDQDAAVLAICHQMGWQVDDCSALDHPLRRRALAIVAAACGLEMGALDVEVDEHGALSITAPVKSLAFGYAVLADPRSPAWRGEVCWRGALEQVRQALAEFPQLASGTEAVDATITRETRGKIVAQLGGAGVVCLAHPERRLGLVIHIAEGTQRDLGRVAVASTEELKLADPATFASLRRAIGAPRMTVRGRQSTSAALAIVSAPAEAGSTLSSL
jgi:L-asparaginase II